MDTNSSLESLNLNSNPLKELSTSFFKTMVSLTSLHLANAGLHELPQGVFTHMRRLRVLNLADNALKEIRAETFKTALNTLQRLNLSRNPLNCSACANLEFRQLLLRRPLVLTTDTTTAAATCRYPAALNNKNFMEVDISYYPECHSILENMTMPSARASKGEKKGEEESPYKSKLGPLYYNPMMGWYTAATLSGMLVIFLLCLALDKAKRAFYKWRGRRRRRREKGGAGGSYHSGSLRAFSGKGSHASIDGMDSISMVALHGNTHMGSFNTSFNTSFDTDKDSLPLSHHGNHSRTKSNLSLGTPPALTPTPTPTTPQPLTNDNRAARMRLKYKERRARPDSLSLSTTSQKTYRFPTIPIDTLTNSLEQVETNLWSLGCVLEQTATVTRYRTGRTCSGHDVSSMI